MPRAVGCCPGLLGNLAGLLAVLPSRRGGDLVLVGGADLLLPWIRTARPWPGDGAPGLLMVSSEVCGSADWGWGCTQRWMLGCWKDCRLPEGGDHSCAHGQKMAAAVGCEEGRGRPTWMGIQPRKGMAVALAAVKWRWDLGLGLD